MNFDKDQLWAKVRTNPLVKPDACARSDATVSGDARVNTSEVRHAPKPVPVVAAEVEVSVVPEAASESQVREAAVLQEAQPEQAAALGLAADPAVGGELSVPRPTGAYRLSKMTKLIRAQDGTIHLEMRDRGNPYAVALSSSQADAIIRDAAAQDKGAALRKAEVSDIKYHLQGYAEKAALSVNIWYRVAPIPGGIEIDVGDEAHTRFRITAGKFEIVESGSDVVFYRTAATLPMTMPAEVGDAKLLQRYANMPPATFMLLLAWVTFTMASPKLPTSKYLILVLQAGEGSGKSALTKLLIRLIDPNRIGVQKLHRKPKDFAIAAQNAHVVAFDNLRAISPDLADLLCMASTGGSISSRQLYTDADQTILNLHVALILNGIHQFVQQQDFAQRTLPLTLRALPDSRRKSEDELAASLAVDLPVIQRGLFDLIAKIRERLPSAVVTHPTRMLAFSKWLAAMEAVYEAPAGIYQGLYSEALSQAQLDSLQESLLASAMLDFAESLSDGRWLGAPTDLLNLLNVQASAGTQRSRDWPQNPIALSKRLIPLQAGLLSQGVAVELTRGKNRAITIKATGGTANA